MKSIFSGATLALVAALWFAPSGANAQPQPKTYTILSIAVEGAETADARTIIVNSGLKSGDEISVPSDALINAVKQLWSLNLFADVEILISKEIRDGVELTIRVEEYPRLEKIVVEGEDEIDEDDILDETSMSRGHILKPQKVRATINRVMKLYEEEGLLNAEIEAKYYVYDRVDTVDEDLAIVYWRNEDDFDDEYELEYDLDDLRNRNLVEKIKNKKLLMFDIEENDPVVVRKIEFTGNETFDDDDLRDELEETAEARWWKFWSSAQFNREKFEEDKQKLVDFYHKNGYRDAEILGDTLVYRNDKQDLDVYISLHEGPQYVLRHVEWEGNSVYTDEQLTQRLNFREGEIYDYEKLQLNLYQNERQTDVSSLYMDNGYLAFRPQLTENRVEGDSVDLLIRVNEGNQFRVNGVDIEGNDKTMEKVIRRELYTLPGDFFNRSAALRSLQQLANLQFFNVEKLYKEGLDVRPVSDSTVNVIYSVEEKSSDYLNASIGYSGSFGFSGAVGFTFTNFSLANPFQMGGGQVLNFNWQFGVGNLYRTFTVGFTEPWFMDTPTSVGVEFFDTRQRYYYDMSQTGGTLRVGRRLRWPDDYFYVQGRLKYQHNNVMEGGFYYAEGLSEQFGVGATISRKNIDNPIFPSKGSSLSLDGELSGGPFLPGNVDYYKIGFNAEWYRRLFNSNKFALFLSMNLGYMDELREGTIVNPFEYFFMGGSGLVIATVPLRGYDDRTVNPYRNGERIGGRVSAKYTAEVRFAVALEPMPIYILSFLEAGNVYEYPRYIDLFTLRRSAGFGARILVNPIGLIGFDFGYGFDRKDVDGNEPEWMFHFQFGRGM
ncbi:MAG: outer membrane protein assembly factor BamA [Ignavibacteriales bacterium]|nr:outer membrane protein assembly factor BamA [Ignavibacteriales bacterium]